MGKDPDRVGALQGTEQHGGLRRWNSRKSQKETGHQATRRVPRGSGEEEATAGGPRGVKNRARLSPVG